MIAPINPEYWLSLRKVGETYKPARKLAELLPSEMNNEEATDTRDPDDTRGDSCSSG